MKDRFMFFYNFKQAADNLPDELRLKFYDAMTDYVFKGVEPDDIVVSALIMAIKPYLDNEVSSWGGAREGSGRKRKNQDKSNEIKFNQVELEKLENNQDKSSLIKINQDLQKTKEKTPLNNPQENKNKNIYPPVTPNGVNSPQGDMTTGKKFVKPTIEEVDAYCRESGHSIDCGAFVDFYESKGWKVGKNSMKDWRAAVRNWERGDKAAGGRKASQSDEEFYRQLEAL